MKKVLIIIGVNRVRGVIGLKGLKNDADIFMAHAPKFLEKGYQVTLKYSKPIPADTDILIFSGHGGLINGNMVLLAPAKYKRGVNVLTNEDLISANDIPEKCNVILDACYSGAIKNGTPIKFIKGVSLEKAELVKLNDQKPFIHSGIVSSDSNSPSYEINVNGHNHGAMLYSLELITRLFKDIDLANWDDLNLMTMSMRSLLRSNDIIQDIQFRSSPSCPDQVTDFIRAFSSIVG